MFFEEADRLPGSVFGHLKITLMEPAHRLICPLGHDHFQNHSSCVDVEGGDTRLTGLCNSLSMQRNNNETGRKKNLMKTTRTAHRTTS